MVVKYNCFIFILQSKLEIMPNHVINILEISGHKKHVQDVLNAIKGSDGSCIDFNSFLPMPEEIRHVTAPVRIITPKEYKKQEEHQQLNEEPAFIGFSTGITQKMQKDYLERFGADNWYDWANQHWGTKWGCYDQQMVDVFEAGDQATAQMSFQTAWSGGAHAIQQLSNSFTLVEFKLTYADEDCGSNCGVILFKEGCEVEADIPDYGDASMAIYFECWGGEEDWEKVDGEWKWRDEE